MIKKNDLLHQILTNSVAKNSLDADFTRTICVFDLDSTLFNVAPRTEKIIKEFAIHENFTPLRNIKVNPKDWGLQEIFIREFSKDDSQIQNIFQQLQTQWILKFFSNEYLHYDTPYLGAIHFVQTLSKNNIEIHYLTGRDIGRMGLGTKEVLLKWGFPIASDQHLHLKPHKSMEDHLFKLNWTIDLNNKNPNSDIYFFENEPVNLNAIGRALPDLHLVYLNTTHSRKECVEVPASVIENFHFESSPKCFI